MHHRKNIDVLRSVPQLSHPIQWSQFQPMDSISELDILQRLADTLEHTKKEFLEFMFPYDDSTTHELYCKFVSFCLSLNLSNSLRKMARYTRVRQSHHGQWKDWCVYWLTVFTCDLKFWCSKLRKSLQGIFQWRHFILTHIPGFSNSSHKYKWLTYVCYKFQCIIVILIHMWAALFTT